MRCRPGSIVTIVYEGDSPDDAERYFVGSIEERVEGLDMISPASPLGEALIGAVQGDTVVVRGTNRCDAASHRRGRRALATSDG